MGRSLLRSLRLIGLLGQVDRQELLLVRLRLEAERAAGGEGGHHLVGRLFLFLDNSHGLSTGRAARSCAPSTAASATSVHSRRIARMASSLAGMT